MTGKVCPECGAEDTHVVCEVYEKERTAEFLAAIEEERKGWKNFGVGMVVHKTLDRLAARFKEKL